MVRHEETGLQRLNVHAIGFPVRNKIENVVEVI